MQGMKRILIGISGGIAAYKIPQLIRLLRKNGAETKVVLTPNSADLVGEEALRTVSGNPVYREGSTNYDMDHIRLAEWADIFLISPATANTIAKMAHGIGDNLLTTLALSIRESQTVVVPAMNTVMWENRATQENLATLQRRGVTVLPVGHGMLACDIIGAGRMIEVEEIASYVLSKGKLLSPILKGKKVLISSGPTEEPIDPVRVITNKSSGKMGVSLARQALLMGAEVTLVTGPTQEIIPSGAKCINVRTADEMQAAMNEQFKTAHICIMAAAVSDYRVANYSESKLPRNEQGNMVLELVPNPDILAGLGKDKGTSFLVGFALESGDNEKRALEKMARKNCDMIVFNRADKALGLDSTYITILGSDGSRTVLENIDKMSAAAGILEEVARRTGVTHA
jgi:phosphopantothenoylcysteine decarboxylase/phosphopantothenate--cysteine ligase